MNSKMRKILKSELIKTLERLLDLIVVFGSIIVYAVVEQYMTLGYVPNIMDKTVETFNSAITYSGYLLLVFLLFKIYTPSIFERNFLSSMKSISISLLMANTLLIILTYIFGSQMLFSPMGVFGVILIQLVIFTLYKFFAHKYLSKLVLYKAMVIGIKKEADELAQEFFLDKEHNKTLSVIAYEIDGELPEDINERIKENDDIYITPSLKDHNKHKILQFSIAVAGKDFHIVPKTYEIGLMNSKDESIDDTLVLHIPMMKLKPEQRFIKRTFDIVLSFMGLIVLAPIIGVVAVLIKLDDKGPVFYKQERYKRHNETFYVYKFRSMCVVQNADQINKRPDKNDSRITRVGRFLRATRLDEVPQLINVFKGDMSLVGPRPLIKSEIDEAMKLIPEFYYRSNVKPGLTGLAQVKGKYDTQDKEKIRYDLLYVKKSNFWFDLKIIILTIKVLFTKGSVTEEGPRGSIQETLQSHHLEYTENQHYIIVKK